MKNDFWRSYPELTKNYRTKEEDNLSNDIIILFKKFIKYLKKNNRLNLMGDVQGAVHLFQGVLIEIQKERFNLKK